MGENWWDSANETGHTLPYPQDKERERGVGLRNGAIDSHLIDRYDC